MPYNRIWFSLYGASMTININNNIAFIQSLVQATTTAGKQVGFWTDALSYSLNLGTYQGLSQYALWYVKYDSTPSFIDFVGFGGWTKPTMKAIAVLGQNITSYAVALYY